MNEIQAEQMAENAAVGQAMMQLLGEMYCCEPTEALIKRGVYKYTDCGAWIAFTTTGVKLGSIVEGSSAECTPHDIAYSGDDAAFKAAFWAALKEIEAEADILWREANED
jgi:hypothetical protein